MLERERLCVVGPNIVQQMSWMNTIKRHGKSDTTRGDDLRNAERRDMNLVDGVPHKIKIPLYSIADRIKKYDIR